jgi:ligand-binding sensor domain-containing protein/anti-sigma regulatory factor (Ser/Thr protein kinase)
MKLKKSLLLFFLLCSYGIEAQELVFKNIGVNLGLPSSEVYRVIQDKKGFVWMSTDAGIGRFNGHSFKFYTTADGLPDNTVFDLIEDKKGRIWMNCYNGTICYLDDDKFHIVNGQKKLKEILNKGNSIINGIQFDEEQNLWIGTAESMYKLLADGGYSKIEHVKDGMDSVQCIVKVLNNRKTIESVNHSKMDIVINVALQGKIYFHVSTLNNKTIKRLNSNAPFNPKFCSFFLYNNDLCFSYRNFLYKMDSIGNVKELELPKTVISLNQDPYGNLWVGLANGGVYVFKEAKFDSKPQLYLPNYSISSILFDAEKGIWLSTFEKGLFYAPFQNYYSFPGNPSLNTNIAGIKCFGTGVYVASTNNSIYRIQSKMEIVEVPYLKETNLSNRINFYPYNGKLVICGNKIAIYDTLTNKSEYPRSKTSLTYFGTSVIENQNGNLAFVAQGYYYVLEDEEMKKTGKLPARATTIYKSSQNTTYLGTLAGLYYLKDTNWLPVTNSILATSRINFISEDKHKNIYVATKNNGLFIYDAKDWINLTIKNGLASDICSHVLCDENDTIWVAGNKGISFFKNSKPFQIQTISGSNGLPSYEVSCLERRGNQLFVGTREGLCLIQLNRDFVISESANVYIKNVWDLKTKEQIINHTEISYNKNNLSFFVECPSFKKMFSPLFQYRLIGYSDSLMESDKEVLLFQNLEPGKYRLEVYAGNSNELTQRKSAFFEFTITPPFWRRAWFIALLIFSTSLLIYMLVVSRITKIRKQEQQKTQMNAMITESRMTALQAQMNPHFIFNAINSIQSFVLNNETQNAYDYLAKFAKLVRMVLNNSKRNLIKMQTEIDTLQLYIQMEQIRFKSSFDFVCNLEPGLDASEIELPVMLIQPFIENAIWHGIMPLQEKRKGKIELNVKQNDTSLEISIRDNGVGRKASQQSKEVVKHKSLGMQLVQERLALIESQNNRKAGMQVIDLFDNNKEACGTEVKISIPIFS